MGDQRKLASAHRRVVSQGRAGAVCVITRRACAGAVTALLLAGTLAGCGSGRSVEAYCDTFYGKGGELRQRYIDADAKNDPLQSLVTVLGVPQDLANLFAELEKVAPEDIQPDVKTLQQAFQKQADQVGDSPADPLTGLANGIILGLATSGPYNRVNAWTEKNCGPPPTS